MVGGIHVLVNKKDAIKEVKRWGGCYVPVICLKEDLMGMEELSVNISQKAVFKKVKLTEKAYKEAMKGL